MSYQTAMKRINELEEQLQIQNESIRDNKLTNSLNFNPKVKMGLGLGAAGIRAIAGSTAGAAGALGAISPIASAALMGTMPFMAASQMAQDRKRTTEFKAERELHQRSAIDIRGADILKTGSLVGGKASQIGMNQFMALLAAGALTGNSGLTNAGMAAYGASGVAKAASNPLKAATAGMGLHAMLSAAPGTTVNPITASMAAAPAVLGGVAGGAMKGLGWAATQAGSLSTGMAGSALTGAGGGLTAMGGATQAGGSSLMAMGLTTPMLAVAMGLVTTFLVSPKIQKIMEKVHSKATGQELLRGGAAHQRPRIQQAHMIAQKYSTTRALDQQVNMLGQGQQLKVGEWLQLSYLGAIEKNTSMNRFMVEYIQEMDNEKRTSSDMTQNSMQSSLGHSGHREVDLSGGFQDVDPIDMMEPGLAKSMAQLKRMSMGAVVGVGNLVEQYGSFVDPMAYIKGGEDNPFAKYQRMEDDRLFDDTVERYSVETGLSTSFVNALETSASAVANMGESSQDKLVALAGYNFEVNKISAFKLLDIAKAMGIDEQDSFMGKFRDIMIDAENNRDTRKKTGVTGMVRDLTEGISNIPFLPALLAGGAVLSGGVGLAGGAAMMAAPAVGALGMDLYSRFKGRKKGENTLKTGEEALDSVDTADILPQGDKGISIDASQLQMAADREEEADREKRLGMYEHVALIHEMFDDKYIGGYVRYTSEGDNRRENDNGSGSSSILSGLSGAAGAGIVGLLGLVGAGIAKLLGLAAGAATGILLPLAALAGIGLAGYAIYSNWDTIKEWFGEVKETIFNWAGSVKETFNGWFDSIAETTTSIGTTIEEWVSKKWFPEWMYPDKKKGEEALAERAKNVNKNNPLFGPLISWIMGEEDQPEIKKVGRGILLNGGKFSRLSTINTSAASVLPSVSDNNVARDHLARNSKGISDLGGDKNKVDTPKELELLLKALTEDSKNIGSITVGQQNAMIEQLQSVAATISGAARGTDRLLQDIAEAVKASTAPSGFARARNDVST